MNKAGRFLKFAVAGIAIVLILGVVTMMLWNWLVPVLFSGPEIGFAEALGLLLLSKILFSPWGRGKCGNGGPHSWKHRYYEKLSSMSPEERERFKSRMREKWCSSAPKENNPGPGHSNV